MSVVHKLRKIHLIILEIRFSITQCYYLQSTYILFYFEANKEYYFYYVLLLFYIFIKYSFIDTKNSDYYHWKNVTISPIACTMKTSKYATRSNKIINCNIIMYWGTSVKDGLCTNYFGLINTPTFSRISWIFPWNTGRYS